MCKSTITFSIRYTMLYSAQRAHRLFQLGSAAGLTASPDTVRSRKIFDSAGNRNTLLVTGAELSCGGSDMLTG